MTPADLALALLEASIVFVPLETHAARPWGAETVDEARARYAGVAVDVAVVALDPDEASVPGLSREGTASLLLAMAIGETGLAADVARPEGCYRVGEWAARCDRDRAVGYWQVHPDAWGLARADVQGESGVRVALRALRASVKQCWRMPPEYRLSAYGQGYCGPLEGAAERWRLANKVRGKVAQALARRTVLAGHDTRPSPRD